MKNRITYLFLFGAVIIFTACSTSAPQDEARKKLTEMEETLFSDESQMVDREKAALLIDNYVAYADEFKHEKDAPMMLFKGGDLSMNLHQSRQAIQLFDRIMNEYPEFEKAPQCLFLKAFIYENDLKDLVAARKYYEEFLQKYPDDEFADDAVICIRNLGKSPEELIREFEELMKQNENI
jgi:outer membrane protein assembly factor BamD (BamD/ComL family)